MAQPGRWLWGLVPLALLWSAGNLFLGEAIERDVGRRAVEAVASVAGEAPGARPIAAQIDGRDVTISGEALSADGAARAIARLRSEFGIRRALGGLSQVVAQRPYSWSASRQGNVVALNGFVPDEASAIANVAAAGTALPGLRVDDRQRLAFGAPPGFQAMTQAVLAQLPRLSSGKIALDDARFCIEGTADTPDDVLALQAATVALARDGFQAVSCALEPPVVTPYRLGIEHRAPDMFRLTGFYPSEAARQQILALLRRSFPGPISIEDAMKPAAGAPAAFLAKVTRAIADLARLRQGRAELTGDAYALSGDGPASFDACQALRLQIAQGDGPDSVAQASIICPPEPPPVPVVPPMPPLPDIPEPRFLPSELPSAATPPAAPVEASVALAQPSAPAPFTSGGAAMVALRPYVLSLAADRTGITLSGHLPDAQTREALLALVAASPLKGRLADETQILPGAPAGFAAAARMAATNLLRLDFASASIADDLVTIRGLTCRELIRSEVETSVASDVPSDYRVDAAIALRQTGCVVGPPATCQNHLDALTRRDTVLFAQGTTVVTLDSLTERVIGEAAAILKQCPAARITIEGHANSDGERGGFNNLDLSARRALRVRDELVRRGIDPARLETRGFGIERPLVPHGSGDAKPVNRRVQFTVAR